jgi:predicted TIM-barrel fold metal-dependent hydrolase
MWGNDFPHSAGDWPNSRRVIDDMFSGVPADEKQRILVDNAVEFFHLS